MSRPAANADQIILALFKASEAETTVNKTNGHGELTKSLRFFPKLLP
jgi:hypothetical protein